MFINDNRLTFGHKITPRIWQDNSGYLICYDCVLARTGSYDYLESEVIENGNPDKIIKVYRTPEEVFSPEAIASFENKPFCNEHPEDDVSPQNYKDLMKGTIRNVRRGQGELENCLVGDVVVFDPEVIDLIKSGEKRELSLGYNTDIITDANGKYIMTNIRGNPLALVDSGRAGCATIRDSANSLNKIGGNNKMSKIRTPGKKYRYKYLDEDVFEVVEDAEPDGDEVPGGIATGDYLEPDGDEIAATLSEEPVVDEGPNDLQAIKDMLKKICEHLGLNEEPVIDEEPEEIPEESTEPVEESENDISEEIVADDDDEIEVEEIPDEVNEDKAMDDDN